MKRLCSAVSTAVLLLASASSASPFVGQSSRSSETPSPAPVSYSVDLENRARHEARIEVRVLKPRGEHLELVMSRASPGRYALHEFAKNVYDVEAVDQRGWKLPLERATPHAWRVDLTSGPSEVRFRYTLYADHCDGTYSQIDRSHAHLNAPATFAWPRGFEQQIHDVRFELPEGWRVSTQLPHRRDGRAYRARDLGELLDSPIEVSAHRVYGFPLRAVTKVGERSQEILIALHHEGSEDEARDYVDKTEAIVQESVAVFGEAPVFDHGRYTFLVDYLPWCDGDGMEHRNSTILTSSRSLETSASGLLGTVAHEFFHAWSIERMRPASLEPFDFERANMSDALWFGEGFTSYYDRLLLRRADVHSLERFAGRIGGLVNAALNAPATKRTSPVEVSRQAPFVDAATSNDPNNRENTFLSYYTWGAAVALGLDLSLREREGLTLDGYMQTVWRAHGEVDEPYEVADLERLLGEYTGDAVWAEDYFARFVFDGNAPDYYRLLDRAGFRLRKANPDQAWFGARLRVDDGALRIASNPTEGGPAYEAGLARGDRVVSMNGESAEDVEGFEQRLERVGVGGIVELEMEGRGRSWQANARLQPDPRWEVVPFEELDLPLSAEQQAFRESWLGAKRDG